MTTADTLRATSRDEDTNPLSGNFPLSTQVNQSIGIYSCIGGTVCSCSALAVLLSVQVDAVPIFELFKDSSGHDTQHSVISDPEAVAIDTGTTFGVNLETRSTFVQHNHQVIGFGWCLVLELLVGSIQC